MEELRKGEDRFFQVSADCCGTAGRIRRRKPARGPRGLHLEFSRRSCPGGPAKPAGRVPACPDCLRAGWNRQGKGALRQAGSFRPCSVTARLRDFAGRERLPAEQGTEKGLPESQGGGFFHGDGQTGPPGFAAGRRSRGLAGEKSPPPLDFPQEGQIFSGRGKGAAARTGISRSMAFPRFSAQCQPENQIRETKAFTAAPAGCALSRKRSTCADGHACPQTRSHAWIFLL